MSILKRKRRHVIWQAETSEIPLHVVNFLRLRFIDFSVNLLLAPFPACSTKPILKI